MLRTVLATNACMVGLLLRVGAFKHVIEGLGLLHGLALVVRHALSSRYLSRQERRMAEHIFCGIVISQGVSVEDDEVIKEAIRYSIEAARVYKIKTKPDNS